MQAELNVTECKVIELHARSWNCMQGRGLRAPYVHKSLCFPKSQGHNMVIFQEYQIFNFFSSQFAYNF